MSIFVSATSVANPNLVGGDPYDMDSDLEQAEQQSLNNQNLDSMEEEDSLMEGPMEDLENNSVIEKDDTSLVMDEDSDTKEESLVALNHLNSPVSHTRINKRKNFKPRNIIYEAENQTKKVESPMDLSVQGNNGNIHEDIMDEDERSDDEQASNSNPGLSVVRPEVLFGQQKALNALNPGGGPIPPFLAPFLAASQNSAAGPGAPSMKDAFQEVLKIFGFPPELAEVFAKNAQAMQQQQQESNAENSGISTPGQDQGKYPFSKLSFNSYNVLI